ncbi:hypothetical protein CROQUDRAFT_89765 [Cronartium quercuum f. sp. fusiforme G11]|uniref:Uncharacterized protein n=1 Tax=Cronartium quercuum f. sp. fusiforme G11 TaxID=708437 RepID=A0A9P6TFN7_9BASI|nr:hypothetical protein CROQUDRAFT_89765 [Cronartium quercuum f. sp. fusiforme G11]
MTPRAMYCRFRGCDTLSLPRGLHITVVRQGQIWPQHTFSHATSPSVHRSTVTSPHHTATFNSHLRHCVLGFGHFDLIPLNFSLHISTPSWRLDHIQVYQGSPICG